MKSVPNILSSSRIILAIIFVTLYLQNAIVWRSLSVAVFAVAVVTDFFDGYIARNYEAQSNYGIFLDPLADKVLTFSGFACLPFLNPVQFPWLAIGIIYARDIVITGIRIWAERKNITIQTRYSAKLKTFTQMLFLYAVLLLGVFAQSDIALAPFCAELLQSSVMGWLLWIVVAITVYTGLEYIYVNWDIFQKKREWTNLKRY
ncbi:MAG TPA: CDP-diacylglycerol--glycerol-3-phosphate 3-phosphatidyltransferase [Balneolales bacterium]|nr:CDP-diacylglycerol--glycerol-3-phosphate 3-phosphatidyltransferase [Balneolales bacterium]